MIVNQYNAQLAKYTPVTRELAVKAINYMVDQYGTVGHDFAVYILDMSENDLFDYLDVYWRTKEQAERRESNNHTCSYD